LYEESSISFAAFLLVRRAGCSTPAGFSGGQTDGLQSRLTQSIRTYLFSGLELRCAGERHRCCYYKIPPCLNKPRILVSGGYHQLRLSCIGNVRKQLSIVAITKNAVRIKTRSLIHMITTLQETTLIQEAVLAQKNI
jgi:hypothetical protein